LSLPTQQSQQQEENSLILGQELSEAVVMFHSALAESLGLSVTEWKCLSLLGRMGALPAKQLSDLSGLTTGAITGLVDRLEKLGYVVRDANPNDRRSVIIRSLKQKDLEKRAAMIFGSLASSMIDLSKRYDKKELTAIQSFFRETIKILREQTARLQKRDGND
jgi:DNA-binding MarR family transcriptional regulator